MSIEYVLFPYILLSFSLIPVCLRIIWVMTSNIILAEMSEEYYMVSYEYYNNVNPKH